MNTSRVPLLARASRGGRRLAAPLAVLLVVLLSSCASGFVTTTTGAIVPASVVQAQDITGDALSTLQDVHNAAVMAHDAKGKAHKEALKAGDPVAIADDADFSKAHAKRGATLRASAAGLRAAWDGLSAWKLGTEGAGMASVVGKLRDALPELLNAAVSLGVVSREYADVIGAFFGTAAQGLSPKPLEKKPVASVAVMEPARPRDEWVMDFGRPVVPAIGREIGAPSLSGCTAEDIARGICIGGCTASLPPVCSFWRIGSTAEITPRTWAAMGDGPHTITLESRGVYTVPAFDPHAGGAR